MFNKEAIQELAKAQAITAAAAAMALQVDQGPMALPNDFKLHNLEAYQHCRRRARGVMTTSSVADFAAYVLAHREEGVAVFIDQDRMTAEAVLNLGAPDAPGHADNRATLAPKATAAYRELLTYACAVPLKQAQVAEFLEDWAPHLSCYSGLDGEHMPLAKAVAAVRKITIEAMRKAESTEQQLSASKGVFESVQATSGGDALPAIIRFECEPYHGLESRAFCLRLGIQTGGDKPALTLRIQAMEKHEEEMAEELVRLVRGALQEELPTLVGSYSSGA